jgi:hypothetical protein
LKTIAQKFALLMSSVLVSVFFCEILVRLFFPQQLIILRSDIWRPDSPFGHRHQENANTVINTGEGAVHFITDGNGYRVNRNIPENNTKPDISILAIGDSFIEAIQVENDFAIPEVTRKYLERKSSKTVQVDNTGVGGWDPNHYLLEAKRALAQKRYTLGIVFLYVGNDITTKKTTSFHPRTPAQRHKLHIPNSLKWNEIIQAILYPINDSLETKSHLFILVKRSGRVPLARLGLTAWYAPSVLKVEEVSSTRWKITAEICEEIQSEFSKYNTPVFFVLLPTSYQVHENLFKEYIWAFGIDPATVNINQPNRLIEGEFEARGLHLVDPLEYMRQKAESGLIMFGLVDRHLNQNGHQIVAEYILPVIESYIKTTY